MPEEVVDKTALSNRDKKQQFYAKKLAKEGKVLPAGFRKRPTEDKEPEPKVDPTPEAFRKRPDIPTRGKRKIAEQEAPLPPAPRIKKGPDEGTRLNKYLANSGVAARRKADELIKDGLVKVNDVVVTEMGYKLQPTDVVTYRGKVVKPVRFVYVLLNKPKDYITSVSDERDRRTVMDLIARATTERIYPVGRLDRQTTGLLLFTNDGDLALQLTHPSKGVQKIYEVELDKPVEKRHMEQIAAGLELEDGIAYIDEIAYPEPENKRIVGVTLHIGKNRIVRRIFEHLGYKVVRLDRTVYAGLNKKDLSRGRWRYLTPREVITLKHLGKK